MDYKKFVYIPDVHWGYERKSGHKVSRHDERATDIMLQFVSDFKPTVTILGGDTLDCYPISHHEKHKPLEKEGLRLIEDAEECTKNIIKPLAAASGGEKHYIIGNHEFWLEDFENEHPGLSGMLNVKRLLGLKDWNVVEQGGYVNVGKLTFIHGDQIKASGFVSKAVVTSYERSIRMGHFHTYQAFTKTRPIDTKLGKTGIIVPCLCKKDQKYLKAAPNGWVQGFNYGYVMNDGTFYDYVPIITNNRAVINGKVYKA